MSEQRPVLYCRCAFAKVLPEDVKDGVLERLVASNIPFDSVPDLCEMSAKKDPTLKQLAELPTVRIVACYPRAVRWLFDAAGAPLDTNRAEILNMRTDSVESIWSQLTSTCSKSPAEESSNSSTESESQSAPQQATATQQATASQPTSGGPTA